MSEHHFTLIIAYDVGLESGEAIERLGEVDATDSTVGRGPDGVWTAVFDREAPTFKEALASAVADIRAAGLKVRRVEPDDFVTQAEIAERLGRTSESIRLLVTGQRGDRTFPLPAARTTVRGSLWRWSQVALWARLEPSEIERAQWIAAANARLQYDLFDTPKERAMLKEVARILEGQRG